MSAGELRERVRFERRCEGSNDGAGNTEMEWEPLCTVPGRFKPLPVRVAYAETILAGLLTGRSFWTIRVRYSSDTAKVVVSDRAVRVATGETFNVKTTINLDERKRYIDMDAELGGAT